MGKKGFLPFHYYFAKNLSNTPPFFFLKFHWSIAGATSDHLENGFGQQGNLLIFQLFHGLLLIFIGNFRFLSPF